MILVDTTAWVVYLRDSRSPTRIRAGELLEADIATCNVVRMELLAGARAERHRCDLRRLIARAALVPMQPGDYDQAAAIHGLCRSRGQTVRVLVDCLMQSAGRMTSIRILAQCLTRAPTYENLSGGGYVPSRTPATVSAIWYGSPPSACTALVQRCSGA